MYFLVRYLNDQKPAYKTIKASDHSELLALLGKDQINILKIRPIPRMLSSFFYLWRPKVNALQTLEIINNILLIVKSGVSLHEGLEAFSKESKNSSVEAILISLTDKIENGMALSQAMQKHHDVFGNVVIHLVKMGEETGALPLTLQRAKEYLDHNAQITSKVKTALIYPFVMLSVATLAIALWFVVVLPQLAIIYREMEITLPWLTQMLLNISAFLNRWSLELILFIFVLISTAITVYKKVERVRDVVTKSLLKIPYIKEVIIGFNLAFIMQYLHLALSSGLPLYNAVENISKSSTNSYFKALLERIKERLLNGEQFSTALENEPLISSFSVRMLRVGEKSGALEEQLDAIANFEYDKLDYYATNITKLIEPVFIVLIGLTFATIMLGMMEPIYDLVTQI